MKKTVMMLPLMFVFIWAQAQELKTYKDSLSYAIGILWGQNIKQQGLTDINSDKVGQAISDVVNGKQEMLDIKTANQMVKDHLNQQKEMQKQKNEAEGKAFLTKNADRKGVITLPSGLQYEVLKDGTGPIPTASDKVTVHYEGTLINGTVFDSSIQRGEPATFPVTGVIKGWVEALQLMKVGSKWKLFIPSDLAYGERGAGGQIGPYATLIFEVELLGIE
ncbi:MAG: FKBP-type peptidyl-prolyl cis-trans isomerase [Lewinellaceae bacterium]|nr:FKBP-type peptidyl-prolyl cis-trans isomerase [Saprospiraceae bacterium]MCB9340090.1 FKBP-type peptidyl-prolyl cis-trans isomerase [Lewinellaceae bacterium]